MTSKHPSLSCSGGEVYFSALQTARSRVPSGKFYQIDAEHLPFYEEFDTIGAFDVLEHIDNDRQSLAEIYRSLRPGGGVILTVPQHPSLWSETDSRACHKRRYSRSNLVSLLKKAGFCLSFTSSFITLLLPAMAASRLAKELLSRNNVDPYAEMKITDRLNNIFGYICHIEMEIIRKRISLPIGGSLLAVAIKTGNSKPRCF